MTPSQWRFVGGPDSDPPPPPPEIGCWLGCTISCLTNFRGNKRMILVLVYSHITIYTCAWLVGFTLLTCSIFCSYHGRPFPVTTYLVLFKILEGPRLSNAGITSSNIKFCKTWPKSFYCLWPYPHESMLLISMP